VKNLKHFGLIILAITFFACENYERKPQGNIVPTASVLKIAQNSVWLKDSVNEVFVNKFLMRINWTEARFTCENGVPAEAGAVQYILEMDTADFSSPVVLATTEKLFADLFSGFLHEKIVNWYGGEIDTTKYISFRVKIIAEKLSEPIFSNSLALKVDNVKPEDEIAVTPEIPEITVKIRKAAECAWENIYVYAWGAEEIYGGWPGQMLIAEELQEGQESGWLYFVLPGIRPVNLILNKGTGGEDNQFDFLYNPTENGCYEITNSTFTEVDCEE
jgi:hypothetical protein